MELEELDLKYIWHPCSQMKDYESLKPIVVVKGRGPFLYDRFGKEYIDVVSSWWCNLLGHCNPKINAKIKAQLDNLEHVIFANFTHEPAIRLCEKLIEIVPKGLKKFNFSDNGSSSIECSLKMAFQFQHQSGRPQKTRFMCLTNAYHGETIGALSVGDLDLYAKLYRPMLMESIRIEAPDCYRCPYGKTRDSCECECCENAKKAFERFGEETCALIVEPLLQGSAGMKMYPPEYLRKLRALCDRFDVLLIADEIATGMGRTGKMFAFDWAGVSPDIMCLSKGLTGGYLPMSLTIATDEIYNAFYADYNEHKAFLHSHTYSGNPIGCAAALAVQEIFQEEPILENSRRRAKFLTQKLNETLGDDLRIGEIRNLNLIHAMELTPNRAAKAQYDPNLRVGYQVYRRALEKGLLLRPLGDVLYFNPPLNIDEETLERAVKICADSIREVVETL